MNAYAVGNGVILVTPTRIISIPGMVVFVKESDAHGDTWVRVK